jgi:hypothetical protein
MMRWLIACRFGKKGERSIYAVLLGFLARTTGDRKAVNYR